MWTAALLGALALALGGLIPGSSAPAAVAATGSSSAEDFSYTSWSTDIDVRTDGRHASARITETVTPVFSEQDLTHGVVRRIPLEYRGTLMQSSEVSVTDGSGARVRADSSVDDDILTIRVGDPDRYAHGEQTYVISYTLTNPIVDSGSGQTFAWDVLPADRPQRIGTFELNVHLDRTLAAAMTGAPGCVSGSTGATTPCRLSSTESGDGLTLRLATALRDVRPYEGVTIDVPLAASTVELPGGIATWRLAHWLLAIGGTLDLALIALGGVLLARRARQARRSVAASTEDAAFAADAHRAIVPEYAPRLAPALAAQVLGRKARKRALAAQLLSVAVQGAVAIDTTQGTGKRVMIRPNGSHRTLTGLDRTFFTEVLGGLPAPRPLRDRDGVLGRDAARFLKAVDEDAATRGLIVHRDAAGVTIWRIQFIAVFALLHGLSQLGDTPAGPIPAVIGVLALVGAIGSLLASLVIPDRHLTEAGRGARVHLRGLREYLRLAEADRIRLLQSPSGAPRRQLDGHEVVHVYERLLPYATLFGLERAWLGTLALTYTATGTSSGWYAGDPGSFTSDIGSFSSTATSLGGHGDGSGGDGRGGSVGGGGGGGSSGGW